jgi:hypothetical protein
MSRVAGSISIELVADETKLRSQYRNVVEELKRTVVPIELRPTAAGTSAGTSAGAPGSPAAGGSSTAAAQAFVASAGPAAQLAAAYSFVPAAAAFTAASPSPGGFPLTGGQIFAGAPAAAAGGGGGGGGAAQGAFGGGRYGPSLFRVLRPLFVADQGIRAFQAYQEGETAVALAGSPLAALQARSKQIDQITSGLFGRPIGLLADLAGPAGPSAIREELAIQQNIAAGDPGIREALRARSEGIEQRAAFRSGGLSARAFAQRAQAGRRELSDLQQKIDAAGAGLDETRTRIVSSGTGAPGQVLTEFVLPDEVRNQRRSEIAAFRQKQKEVQDELNFNEGQAKFSVDQERAGLRAEADRFRDFATGVPDEAAERRGLSREQAVRRADVANRNKDLLPAQDEADRQERNALVERQSRAAQVRALESAGFVAAAGLRGDNRLVEATRTMINATYNGRIAATPAGDLIERGRLETERQASLGELNATVARDRGTTARASAFIQASLADALARRPLAASLNALSAERERAYSQLDADDLQGRQDVEAEFTGRERLTRQQFSDRRRLTIDALVAGVQSSGLRAQRKPLTGEAEDIANQGILAERRSFAENADPIQSGLILEQTVNNLQSFRNQLTAVGTASGNPALADFSGSDASQKDQLEALKRIEGQIERLNELMAQL